MAVMLSEGRHQGCGVDGKFQSHFGLVYMSSVSRSFCRHRRTIQRLEQYFRTTFGRNSICVLADYIVTFQMSFCGSNCSNCRGYL